MVRVGATSLASASLELYSSNKGWTLSTSKLNSDWASAGGLKFVANRTTEVMTMALNGKVGIGDTNPLTTLTVAGDISGSNDLYIEGNIEDVHHITASGDISASGIITGEQITSTDDASINDLLNVGRIRGNGNTITGHLSIQSPTSFVSHITASGNISSSGQLIATSADFNDGNISNVGIIDLDTIRGDGDTNTNIAFSGDDVMTFKVGNEAVLTLTQGDGSLGDIVSVGDGGDVNFRVRTNGENNTIFVEGSSNNVGIGNSTPPKKLTVEGDISASGALNVTGDITSSGNFRGNRRFNKTSSTIADHSGDIVYFGGTTSMDNGKIYHFKNDGTWELANADAASTSDGLLGVAL